MYEERKKRINWAKLFLVVIIVFLLILLGLKIISLIKYNNNPAKYYASELDSLQSNAIKYFNKDNVPKEIGESNVVYLNQFEEKGINHELIPMDNDSCDLESSYIRATKLETEYQIRSYIKCEKFEDSKIDYIKSSDIENTTTQEKKEETTKKIPETSKPKEDVTTTKEVTTTTTKKQTTTTKKQTTTTKKQTTTVSNKITIGFNTNGGEQIGSYTISKGSKVKLPIPVRNGYTFVGWYKNNVHYTSDTVFNDNIILVAKWTKN